MSIEETDAVVASSLGVEMIPEEVKAIIRQKGQGNPFFVSQIAYTLRDTGYISAGIHFKSLFFVYSIHRVHVVILSNIRKWPMSHSQTNR